MPSGLPSSLKMMFLTFAGASVVGAGSAIVAAGLCRRCRAAEFQGVRAVAAARAGRRKGAGKIK